MSDAADQATDVVERGLALTLSGPRPALLPGVAGECEDCERASPRLVGGRCAFCRDGRVR